MKSALSSVLKNVNINDASKKIGNVMKQELGDLANTTKQSVLQNVNVNDASQKVGDFMKQGLGNFTNATASKGSSQLGSLMTQGLGQIANVTANATATNETPPSEFKNVDKKENSNKIGKIVKQKFEELNDTTDVGKVVFSGLEKQFNDNKPTFSKEIFDTLRHIVHQYMLSSTYANEENFKRIIFTNIVEKTIAGLKKNTSNDGEHRIVQNIGLKLYNIMVIQNSQGGGDGHIGGDSSGEKNKNNNDAADIKMKCFVTDRTEEILQTYFNKNVSSQSIGEDIIFQLCKLVYSTYNNDSPTNQKKLSEYIDGYVVKVMEKTANTIIDFFPENKMLETLYILLDDVVIQGFIKQIGDNHATLSNKVKEKPHTDILPVLEKMHEELKRNIKSKPPVYFLEHLNTRISQALKSLQQTGGETGGETGSETGDTKISLAPTDYNIDDIIVSIVKEGYTKIEDAIDVQLTQEGIMRVFTEQITAYFQPPWIDNIDDVFSGLFVDVLHCLFEMFNDNFYLHVFYVTNLNISDFNNIDTPLYNALIKTIPHYNKTTIHKTTGLNGENPFITETIYEFKTITQSKTQSMPPATASSTSTTTTALQKGGRDNNYTIYADNPKKMVIHDTIYEFINKRVLQSIYSSKFKDDLFNIIHEPLLKKIDAIKPVDTLSSLEHYSVFNQTVYSEFISKSIRLALHEIQKNPKMFTKTKPEFIVQYLCIVMNGLMNEYLYMNIRSTKVSLQLNMNALSVFFNVLKPTYFNLYIGNDDANKGNTANTNNTADNKPNTTNAKNSSTASNNSTVSGGKSNKRTRHVLRQPKTRFRRFSKKNSTSR